MKSSGGEQKKKQVRVVRSGTVDISTRLTDIDQNGRSTYQIRVVLSDPQL